jgi:isorenieratene synthase
VAAPSAAISPTAGAQIRCDTAAVAIEDDGRGRRVVQADGERLAADAVVLAADRAALQRIVAASPRLGDDPWRAAVARGRLAPRFVVQRLWFRPADAAGHRPVRGGPRPTATSTNVSAVHLLEEGAAAWARRTGGSVVELHAYAVPDEVHDAEVVADLRRQLARLHPELDGAARVHEELLVEQDCPLAGDRSVGGATGGGHPRPRPWSSRATAYGAKLPVALMERAATTGLQAANLLLDRWGLPGHDLWSVPTSTRFGPAVGAARRLLRQGAS